MVTDRFTHSITASGPALGLDGRYEFIDAETYLELACSNRILLRSDLAGHGLRGLFDAKLNKHFYVEEKCLYRVSSIEER